MDYVPIFVLSNSYKLQDICRTLEIISFTSSTCGNEFQQSTHHKEYLNAVWKMDQNKVMKIGNQFALKQELCS